jgi:hypothetical protein
MLLKMVQREVQLSALFSPGYARSLVVGLEVCRQHR